MCINKALFEHSLDILSAEVGMRTVHETALNIETYGTLMNETSTKATVLHQCVVDNTVARPSPSLDACFLCLGAGDWVAGDLARNDLPPLPGFLLAWEGGACEEEGGASLCTRLWILRPISS